MKQLLIIYDFDGTLTPSPIPLYPIFAQLGYPGDLFIQYIDRMCHEENMEIFPAYCESIYRLLTQNHVPATVDSICTGVENVRFNPGVIEYFPTFHSDAVKHVILTSGIAEFVERTAIGPYLTEVIGTRMQFSEHGYTANPLVSPDQKAVLLEKIPQNYNISWEDTIYIGDGFTDKPAFEFVHAKGGTTIYLDTSKNPETLAAINEHQILNCVFDPDYRPGSELYQYITQRVNQN